MTVGNYSGSFLCGPPPGGKLLKLLWYFWPKGQPFQVRQKRR
jgi:hypothetical protein